MKFSMGVWIIGVLIIANPATAGSIKKWIDAEGNVHFGDAPPAARSAEEVELSPGYKGEDTDNAGGLRPGERLMLEQYERRYSRPPSQNLPSSNSSDNSAEYDESRCEYYKLRKQRYERKLKSGYKQSERQYIDERIAWYNMKVSDYCR